MSRAFVHKAALSQCRPWLTHHVEQQVVPRILCPRDIHRMPDDLVPVRIAAEGEMRRDSEVRVMKRRA